MKSNKIIGGLSILWGTLFFLFTLFFPNSVYDLYGDKLLTFTTQKIEQSKLVLENLHNLIHLFSIITLIALIIVAIINLKKNNIKLFTVSKNRASTSTFLMLAGFIFHILGLYVLSCTFVAISGILLIKFNEY